MKIPTSKTFAGIVIFMLVVSMACSLSGASPTVAPKATSAATATATSAASETPGPPSTLATSTAPAGPGAAAGGGCANPYYPVAIGDTWSYTSTTTTTAGAGVSGYSYTTMITAVSDKGFTTGVQASTGANTIVKWNCQAGNLAVLDIGIASTTATVKLNYNSVTSTGYSIPVNFDTGNTWNETVTLGATAESGGRTINSQIVLQLACTAAGADKITVPLGSFDTVKAACTKTVAVSAIIQGKTTPGAVVQENITYWYAKNVGLVKSVGMLSALGNNNATPVPTGIQTVVLTKYKVQ